METQHGNGFVAGSRWHINAVQMAACDIKLADQVVFGRCCCADYDVFRLQNRLLQVICTCCGNWAPERMGKNRPIAGTNKIPPLARRKPTAAHRVDFPATLSR